MSALVPEAPMPADLVIDDLAFTDLLKIALDDLPGASGGAWTLHGPVDPGITLLELFAWQLEQRLYAAEQVTDDQVGAGLGLLGLPGPAPARVATTVLALTAAQPNHVAAGAVLALADDDLGRRYSLVGDVDVLPVHRVDVAGTVARAGDALELLVDRDGPRLPGRQLTLLVRVETRVPPAWDAEAASVAAAADLRWVAVGPDGTEEVVEVADGTGGLRRSGLIRLPWPAAWDRVGGYGCRLRLTVTEGGWSAPPRLLGVHANAVIAHHLVDAEENLTDQLPGLLPLPFQVLRVSGTAGLLADGPGAVTLDLGERDGAEHRWTSVSGWLGTGPDDRVFVVDRARGELRFGTGLAGRVPRPAPGARALVRYAVGAGAGGNVGSRGVWAEEGGAVVGTNPVAGTGGADPEPITAARQRAADELTRPDRVVTAADAAVLALSTPGVAVARVHVSPGHHPGHPCVEVPSALTVTVVPEVDRSGDPEDWVRAPLPDRGLVAAVLARLAASRLLGQEVFVGPPGYRSVRVRVGLTRSSRDAEVAARVTRALREHLDPLRGGPDGDGWPFGGVVRPSELVGVAARAAGAEAVVSGLAVALDDAPATDCTDLTTGPRDLVRLDAVDVEWRVADPDGGGLA